MNIASLRKGSFMLVKRTKTSEKNKNKWPVY